MKWIKASERLPNKVGWFFVKGQGIYMEIATFDNNRGFQYAPPIKDKKLPWEPKDIYWLDESGSEPEGKEAVEFADWKDENFTSSAQALPFFFAYQSSKYYKEPKEYYSTKQLYQIFKNRNNEQEITNSLG